jgi:hypothetical protein
MTTADAAIAPGVVWVRDYSFDTACDPAALGLSPFNMLITELGP